VTLKVAFISPQYPNISRTGGSLYAYHLASALDKKCKTKVFIPNINSKELDDELDYRPIDVIRKPFLRNLSFSKRVSDRIEPDNFDIIHVNEIGGLFLEKLDVITLHHAPDTLKKMIHLSPVYLEALKSKKIVTVSKDSKDMLSKSILFNEKKISIVPNGINPKFLQKIDENKVEKLKQKYEFEGKKVAFYINSNFTKRKNLPLMIETAKYLKRKVEDFRLIILCKKKHYREVQKKLKMAGIEDITRFISNLSDEELVYHYALADLLAMPSTREGFGFPLIEALATKTPFVSFDVGVASELVEKGYGVIADDDEDFKRKCTYILNHTMVYDGSKDFIRKNYSWESSAESLIDIYKHSV